MTYSLDVSVLLYASDTASPFHERAAAFVSGLATHDDILCLTWPVVMGYVRIATHASIFANPLTPGEATANVQALLRLPRARTIAEEDGFWDLYREVSQGLAVRGNHVPDAHIATLLRLHGVRRLYTADADFRRFAFLEPIDPVA